LNKILSFRSSELRFPLLPAASGPLRQTRVHFCVVSFLAEQVIDKDEQVVCILTGHELKDANATVKYHTGIDMKAAQDDAPRGPTTGKYANAPIQVDDDLAAIIKAIGAEPEKIKGLGTTL